MKKHWIEKAAVRLTVQRVFHEEEINRLADALVELQSRDNNVLPALKNQLRECERGIDNILNAIQMGIITSSTKERLESLETQKKELLASIAQIELERPVYSKEAIVKFIYQFKGGDMDDPEYQKQIIDIFLNAIYVYDDKLVFTYNFKEGTETISLAEIEAALCSDLTCLAPPKKNSIRSDGVLFCRTMDSNPSKCSCPVDSCCHQFKNWWLPYALSRRDNAAIESYIVRLPPPSGTYSDYAFHFGPQCMQLPGGVMTPPYIVPPFFNIFQKST